MRWSVMLCGVAFAIGCGTAEDQAAEVEPASGTTLSLADLAGEWTVNVLEESSDSVIITYDLKAAATPDGWTATNPGGEPTPVRVVLVDGDSLVTEAGPFVSALRPGLMASTRSVVRLEGNVLTGTMVAHYETDEADSVVAARLRGVRTVENN